ncbi:MAG TPA: tail fiber protein [Beijerinckiaceae bacterium]|jgi:microcystin-dependent protein
MPQPYIGEIRMFAGNFAPAGWMFCEGQTLPIAENDALFTLIGTTYGGDGQETFNLPNLASRVPIHMGTSPSGATYQLAEMAGTEQETLTTQQMPTHNHLVQTTTAQGVASPVGAVFALANSSQQGVNVYINSEDPNTTLTPSTIGPAGGSQPHENVQPFLCINFIISLFGIFPSQT